MLHRGTVNVVIAALFAMNTIAAAQAAAAAPRPSVVVIVADDLGHGDVGAFGQTLLETPALDSMAAEGMRFTQFYAGATEDAASRRVALTGLRVGRIPVPPAVAKAAPDPRETPTVLTVLAAAGYATACIGDWPVEAADAGPEPVDAAVKFIRERRAAPFLLLLSLPSRRATEAELAEFAARQWPAAAKAHAASVRRIDRDAGRILAAIRGLGRDASTLVIFAADTGPAAEVAGALGSTGRHRGGKGDVLEGGIRVPMIARWPGAIPAGGENDRQWYLGDLLATAADLAGVKAPPGLDSDSFAAALRGEVDPDQWKRKSVLYWASADGTSAQATRFGKWKAVRSPIETGPVELYDLSHDFGEKRDYSPRRADLVRHATNLLNQRGPSADRGTSPAGGRDAGATGKDR
jgi:arylsulfatase A